MRIRGGVLGLSDMCGWREEKWEKRGGGEESFSVVGSSWCVSGFLYENLE